MINIKFIKMLIVFILLYATPLWAGWQIEEEKINFLLDEITNVNGTFIRNGTEYPPEKAVEHLKMKFENAMNSWFAPNKEKWTAEMFIGKIVLKSSISGKRYQIKFNTGQTVNAGNWLHERLKNFQQSQRNILIKDIRKNTHY
jgi:hypothetical protein